MMGTGIGREIADASSMEASSMRMAVSFGSGREIASGSYVKPVWKIYYRMVINVGIRIEIDSGSSVKPSNPGDEQKIADTCRGSWRMVISTGVGR